MISREGIKYSLKNIYNNKPRSFLTIFSILVGITTIFIFLSFGLGLYEYVQETVSGCSANKIVVQARGSGGGISEGFSLTKDDLETVKNSFGVKRASGMSLKVAQVKQDKQMKYVFVTSFDPDENILFELVDAELDEGRWLRSREKRRVILGHNFLDEGKIFDDSYDLGERINIDKNTARVVGFLKKIGNPQDDSNIYMTQDYFDELYPETDFYSMIVAEADKEELDRVIEEVEEELRDERGLEEGKEDFYVQSFEEMVESYTAVLDIIFGIILIIALISVVVSAVNTANTMITSVLERYREIGVLKAIGAKNSEIFYIFFFESAFLGFVAGILGVLFGWAFTATAGFLLDYYGFGFLNPSESVYLFLGCIFFSTVTGAISGVFPAISASRTNTVDALRYE